MTKLLPALLAAVALTACHTQTSTAPAGADPTMQDTDGIIARFTRDIWPAVEGYRFIGGQDSDRARKFRAITDSSSPVDHDKVISLGKVTNADGVIVSSPVNHFGAAGDQGLHLASASLSDHKDSSASVVACYTYTETFTPIGGEAPETRPGASEATFILRKTDNWYLSDIVNDHAVADCQSSKA